MFNTANRYVNMFKYSDIYQRIADDIARQHRFYAAYYKGTYKDYGVFGFIYYDSRTRYTGSYRFLLMDENGKTQMRCVGGSPKQYKHSILPRIKYESDDRREQIYDELMTKLAKGDYSKKTKKYLQYLYDLDLHNWNEERYVLLSRESVLLWLEASQRFDDEIAIFRERCKINDGWGYRYIVAIRDIFTKHIEECAYMKNWKIVKYPKMLKYHLSFL